MTPRLDYFKAAPEAMKAMLALETASRGLSIPAPLRELVKMRVAGHFVSGQEVIVQRGVVCAVHPDSQSDVGAEACIQAYFPPPHPGSGLAAAGDDDRSGKFAVDPQQVGYGIPDDAAALGAQAFDRIRDRFAMQRAQGAVDLDIPIVPLRPEPMRISRHCPSHTLPERSRL